METHIWYLAYGSNMSPEKFTHGRGIQPLLSARVSVPGWKLQMDIPGLPYSEPSFSSIAPSQDLAVEKVDSIPDVIGVAYLLTSTQYKQVLASEGGGTAYNDVCLRAEPLTEKDLVKTGTNVLVRTLTAAMSRHPAPRPSERYMEIIRTGAQAVNVPDAYQEYLESVPTYSAPTSRWGQLGAMLFLALFQPLMGLLEKLTNLFMRKDGTAPSWIVMLVRSSMQMIWWCHDQIFAPVFGRGDGYDDGSGIRHFTRCDLEEKNFTDV